MQGKLDKILVKLDKNLVEENKVYFTPRFSVRVYEANPICGTYHLGKTQSSTEWLTKDENLVKQYISNTERYLLKLVHTESGGAVHSNQSASNPSLFN